MSLIYERELIEVYKNFYIGYIITDETGKDGQVEKRKTVRVWKTQLDFRGSNANIRSIYTCQTVKQAIGFIDGIFFHLDFLLANLSLTQYNVEFKDL